MSTESPPTEQPPTSAAESTVKVPIPEWVFKGFSGVAFALIIPVALWTINLEYQQRDAIKNDREHSAEIARLEAKVEEVESIKTDLEVIKVEIQYIKDGQAELKTMIQRLETKGTR